MHDDVVASSRCGGDEVDLRLMGEDGFGTEVEPSVDERGPRCGGDLRCFVSVFEFVSGESMARDEVGVDRDARWSRRPPSLVRRCSATLRRDRVGAGS